MISDIDLYQSIIKYLILILLQANKLSPTIIFIDEIGLIVYNYML